MTYITGKITGRYDTMQLKLDNSKTYAIALEGGGAKGA